MHWQKQNDHLEQFGYRVSAVARADEALAIFKDAPDQFDLVITDMVMPGMSGDKLAAALINIRPEIPIVFCTGYDRKISETRVKQMGGKALVMKPFISKELALTIRNTLDLAPE